MFGNSNRNRQAINLYQHRSVRASVLRAVVKGAWHWRRQLAPLYTAPVVLAAGIGAAILLRTAGTGWFSATYTVGGLCSAAWLSRLHGYDRAYAALVAGITAGWTMWVAIDPATPELYGALLLGTPVLGLGWWLSGTLRGQLRAEKVKARWDRVAELAGIAGAKLTATRSTPAGEVLTVKLAPEHSLRDVSRERIEGAYELRPGAVKVEQDKGNSRRVFVHITETDPWSGDLSHPAVAVLHSPN